MIMEREGETERKNICMKIMKITIRKKDAKEIKKQERKNGSKRKRNI